MTAKKLVDRYSAKLLHLSLERPRLVLLLWLVVLTLAAPGLTRLQVEESGDSALDREDPAWRYYEESKERFGGDEVLVLSRRSASAYDAELLAWVEQVSQAADAIDGVRRVDSLATVSLIRVDDQGDLETLALLERPEELRALPDQVARLLAHDRIAPDTLISRDGRTVAVNLLLEGSYTQGHEALLDAAAEIVDRDSVAISGVPTFRVATNRYTQSELLFFSPLTAGLLFVLVAVLLGGWRASLVVLAPGPASAAVAMGLMGWSGVPLGITTLVLPPILIALGCAYGLHVMVAVRRHGGTDLRVALSEVRVAVWISGLTTALGFAALVLGRIDLVTQLGVFGSLGVATVTLAVSSLVPSLLASFPTARSGRALRTDRTSMRAASWLGRHRRAVTVVWAVVVGISALGLPRLRVDTDLTRWLPLGNPVRDDYETIRSELSGISPVNVVVEVPPGASVLDGAHLDGIDRLSAHLESLPGVGRAISIADPLRQIHGAFTGDPRQPLPVGRRPSEQYLLMLESVEQIGDLVTPDRLAANILLRVDDNSSTHLLSLDEQARTWWQENVSAEAQIRATGLMFEYARAEDAIAEGQLRGLAAALLSISGLLLLTVGTWRRAVLAIVPNVAPLVVLFGAMGWLAIPLDVGTAIVATLTLGIAVDDTVHLLSHYDDARSAGSSRRDALRRSFELCLLPLLGSTIVLALAFGLFAASEFSMTRNLGILTAAIMGVCLAADLSLLGAALVGGRNDD